MNIFLHNLTREGRLPVSHTKFHIRGFGNMGVHTIDAVVGENFVSPHCSVSMRLIHYWHRGICDKVCRYVVGWLVGWSLVRHVREL